jgi:hypothetical protein
MKNIYSLLLLGLTNFAVAQTTIYTENFGAGTGSTNTLVTAYSGFQSPSPINYTGNSDIRTTFPSTGYTGASAAGCLFLGATTTATLPEKFLTVSGINTSGYKDLSLSFGHYNGVTGNSIVPKVEVSEDGTNWTALSYSRIVTNISVWEYVTATGTIPAIENLRIRFTNPVNSNIGFRVDDIKLTGTQILAVNNAKKEHFNIYPTVVSNGIICITSVSNQTKKVNIYDSTAKLVISKGTDKEINVSQLPKGTYIMNIEENGAVESKKFIIK